MRAGQLNIIDCLINEFFVDVNTPKDLVGTTALHLATSKDVASLLIEYGANVFAERHDGTTVLDWAQDKNRTKFLDSFLLWGLMLSTARKVLPIVRKVLLKTTSLEEMRERSISKL